MKLELPESITNINFYGFLPVNWTKNQLSYFIKGFCVSNILLFGFYVATSIVNPELSGIDIPKISLIPNNGSTIKTSLREYLFIIKGRNIFGLPKQHLANIVDNTLPLRLVGVLKKNNFKALDSVAILEDLRSNEQDVFGVGEFPFNMGEILSIDEHTIDILVNDNIHRLQIEEGLLVNKNLADIEKKIDNNIHNTDQIKEVSFRNFEVKKSLVVEVLDNLDKHLISGFSKQHKDGILVYGLGKNSVFKNLGITDFDIISSVNGKSVDDFFTAVGLFKDLKSQGVEKIDHVVISLIRAGQEVSLHYSLVD